MRPAVCLRLLVLGLVALAVRGQATAEAPRESRAPTLASWTVEGTWADTREEAVLSALKEARKELTNYLSRQVPPVHWAPDEEFIRNHLVRHLPENDGFTNLVGKETRIDVGPSQWRALAQVKTFDNPVGEMWQVRLHVKITDANYREILRAEETYQKQQRQLRAHERQTLLAKVLAGVVALLAAVAGYLRLEDATKGYYTALLRLGAVAFMAAVGAAIWLLS